MYNPELKEKVKALRSAGMTYTEIQHYIKKKIPKSSLSYICKDIVLSDKQKQRVDEVAKSGLARAREKALIVNKGIFDAKLNQYRLDNYSLVSFMHSREAKLVALAILYLGEGAKWQSHRGLCLGSSSASIIKLYIKLLNDCYGIELIKMKGRIQHRADQDSEILLAYWSKVTGIQKKNFYSCYKDKRTNGVPTQKADYRGVCTITCAGTHIQLELAEIAGIIDESVWGISAVG